MKIRIFIFLSFIAITFCKCRQRDNIQSILITDCYWDILEKNSEHPINSSYKFDKGGNCNFFYYNFYNKQRTDSVFLYDDGDVIVPNKWELISDSNLVIRGIEYYLLKYNADSVFLKGLKNDTTILIKNCKTYHSKEEK